MAGWLYWRGSTSVAQIASDNHVGHGNLPIDKEDAISAVRVWRHGMFWRALTAVIMRHPPQRGGFYSARKYLSCSIYLKDQYKYQYKVRIFQAFQSQFNSIVEQSNPSVWHLNLRGLASAIWAG